MLDCIPHLWGDDSAVRGSRVDEFHRIKVRLVRLETTVVGSKPRSGKSLLVPSTQCCKLYPKNNSPLIAVFCILAVFFSFVQLPVSLSLLLSLAPL